MNNDSGLKPLGRAVLVKPYVPEQVKGLLVLPDSVQERDSLVEQRAVIVEVGPNAWVDEPCPRAVPGDKVLISRFAGFLARGTADNELYRFVNDRDIFAAIEVEK